MPRMRCELRDHEADHLTILPIPQPDGSLDTMACLTHARETEYFCRRHDRPHLGFENGTHACKLCIDEQVEKLRDQARGITSRLFAGLPREEFDRLLEYGHEIDLITLDGNPYIPILRAVVTTAERLGKPWELVVNEALSRKSAESILPSSVSKSLRGL